MDKKNKKEVIKVEGLSKYFDVPHEKRDTLKSYFVNPFHKIKKERFRALHNVSFSIKEGEFVGIMGRNGSGKSTLLKIISGIYAANSGDLTVKGRITPFLSLGVGFNDNLSGRENVYLNGTILGLTKKYLDEIYQEIVDFAELEDFMDLQLKNYSSGMRVRLGFAIAAQAKSDIFILDEVMSVGDINFRQKSLEKMQELLQSGATVLLVTHNSSQVRDNCDRVIVLEEGALKFDGDVEEGIEFYESSMLEAQKISINTLEDKRKADIIRKFEVQELQLLNHQGEDSRILINREDYKIRLKVKINEDIEKPNIGFIMNNLANFLLYGSKNKKKDNLGPLKKGDILNVEYQGKMDLKRGKYTLKFKMWDGKVDRLPIPWHLAQKIFEVKNAKGRGQWPILEAEGEYIYNISKSKDE